jgi:hypothetical protein
LPVPGGGLAIRNWSLDVLVQISIAAINNINAIIDSKDMPEEFV